MDKSLITVTSPLLPDLDDFHAMLKEIRASKWITNNGSFHKQLEKELADPKRQNAITEMAKTARKMLADEEINIPDELLGHLVSESAEDTKAAVEAFSRMYKTAVQAAVKDALKGNPPKGGTGGKTMTKEQIMAISNPVERQRLIAENIALFQ